MGKLGILFIVCGFYLIGCSHKNNPPTIASVTATPSTLILGQATQLSCSANDKDGDALTYSWSTGQSGSFNVVYWVPASTGYFTVTVTVSDGESSVNSNVGIDVWPLQP